MTDFILKLFERFNEMRAAAVSLSGATAGTVVGAIETTVQPSWFTTCAPYLQAGAWSVAIIAGIVTIYKAIYNEKTKK